MQSQMYANVNQVENRPFEMQYGINGQYPSNNAAQNTYIRPAPMYYPLNTQPAYVKDSFDPTPYIPMKTYQQQQHPQYQHLQQSNTVNNNANEFATNIQNIYPVMNSTMNDLPLAANNLNIPLNQQNIATPTQTYNAMDANIDANHSNLNFSDIGCLNFSDIAKNMNNSNELYDAAKGLLGTDRDRELSRNLEELSME